MARARRTTGEGAERIQWSKPETSRICRSLGPGRGRAWRIRANLHNEHRTMSGRPGKRGVTGEGEGFATPVDTAPVGVTPRAEEFACAIAAGDTAALAELYDSTVAKVHALVKAII